MGGEEGGGVGENSNLWRFSWFLPFSIFLITIYILHHLTCKRVLSNFKTIHRNFPHHILYHLTYKHVPSNFKTTDRNFPHHILYHLTYKHVPSNLKTIHSNFQYHYHILYHLTYKYKHALSNLKTVCKNFQYQSIQRMICASAVWTTHFTSPQHACYKQQWRQFEVQILYNLCDQSAVHATTLLHRAD